METLRHLLTVARTRSLMAPKTEPSRQVALARATKAKTSGEGRRRMTKKNPMICFRTINHAKHQWPECNLHEHCQYHITYHFFCLCISYIYNYIYRVLLSSLAQEVQCVLQRPFSSPHNIKHDARCRSPISAGPTSGVLPAFSVLSALCESGQLGKCKHCWVQLRAPIKYLTTHEQYEQLYSAPIAVNNHEKYYSSLGVGI